MNVIGPAGQPHFPADQDVLYTGIFMGVAWPAVRPGFIAVIGEHRDLRIGGEPLLILLDECQESRLWELVQKAAAFQFYYHPERVYGDRENAAAMQFASEPSRRALVIEHSPLCVMEGPFAYAFPVLARLMETGRLVVQKASLMHAELMTAPVHEELGKLDLTDYPAIAALAFAVLGMERARSESVQGRRQTEAL